MVLPKHVTKSDLENIKGLRFFCVTAGMNYPDSNQFAKFSDILLWYTRKKKPVKNFYY